MMIRWYFVGILVIKYLPITTDMGALLLSYYCYEKQKLP